MSLFFITNFIPERGVITNDLKHTPRYFYPLTPFFFKAGSEVQIRGFEFQLRNFHTQNKITRKFKSDEDKDPELEPICGFNVYKTRTSTYNDNSGKDTGTITKDYVFENDRIFLKTTSNGDNINGFTHGRTATTAKSGGGSFHDPPKNNIITLSQPVNKSYLDNKKSLWSSTSEDYKNSSESIYYITNTESDNKFAKIGIGDIRARSIAINADGFSAQWQKHEAFIKTSVRKNSPVIYTEASINNTPGGTAVETGKNIYKSGYAEHVLSLLIDKPWKDDYGTWHADTALDEAPLFKEFGYLSSLPYGDGAAHELTYISKTGKRTRVTFQLGSLDYNVNPAKFSPDSTVVKTTDTTTLIFTISFAVHDSIRISKIEIYHEADHTWAEVANVDKGVHPDSQVAQNACDSGYLLCIAKRRNGKKWGFLERKAPYKARYAKQEFRKHLTVGDINLDTGSCGGSVGGSLDLEIVTEYDLETGLLKEPVVNQWSAVVDGHDWTPETHESFDNVNFAGSSLAVYNSTTIKRTANHTWPRARYFVAMDAADKNGKILTEHINPSPVSSENNQAWSERSALLTPPSGHTTFFEGTRLAI